MNRQQIDNLSPDALADYSMEMCKKMNELMSRNNPSELERVEMDDLCSDLIYVQKKLKSYRIRVGKVNRGIRVISNND